MAPQVSPPTTLIYNYLFSKAGHGGHHQRHHPFLFILINKDIIKGSFPFRKTFRTPKSDFEARFRPPRMSCRPEEPEQNGRAGTKQRRGKPARPEKCPTAPRVLPTGRTGAERQSRNKTAATESFPVRKNISIQRISYLCQRKYQNLITDAAVRSVRKSAFKPLPAHVTAR